MNLGLTRKRVENETPENIRSDGVKYTHSIFVYSASHMSWTAIWILYITTRQLTESISSLAGARVQSDSIVVYVGIDYCRKNHGRVPCP